MIVLRDAKVRPAVLMGQRGASAAFMPNKFVFPGGAVDADDGTVPFANNLNPICTARLSDASTAAVTALAGAAIRELWEETGLILGQPDAWGDAPTDWQSFAAQGMRPDPSALRFVFRAITPPGRPRRFDARFFLLDAAELQSDPDDFTHATDELSHLQWVPLDQARGFDLPFITEVVLAEVEGLLPSLEAPTTVPFFNNNDEESLFQRLRGTQSGPE